MSFSEDEFFSQIKKIVEFIKNSFVCLLFLFSVDSFLGHFSKSSVEIAALSIMSCFSCTAPIH